jgi:hypothetical protein
MIDKANNSGYTVRVIVKLRPDQYDELIRHVREIVQRLHPAMGSTVRGHRSRGRRREAG